MNPKWKRTQTCLPRRRPYGGGPRRAGGPGRPICGHDRRAVAAQALWPRVWTVREVLAPPSPRGASLGHVSWAGRRDRMPGSTSTRRWPCGWRALGRNPGRDMGQFRFVSCLANDPKASPPPPLHGRWGDARRDDRQRSDIRLPLSIRHD